ncbi:hypothetical protein [Nonomuraea rubra]|uniref:hypothetical protein n=1 Tax=Nonomuraea rubra TaxID=46180 RepID=UPI0033F81610
MSRLIDLLNQEDWSNLRDAYGPATEIPALLSSITADDIALRDHAYEELGSRLVHQGVSRFEASAHAAPFLIEWLADPRCTDTVGVLGLLTGIAIGDMDEWLSGSLPDQCLQVTRESAMMTAEPDDQFFRDARSWALESYDAVRRGVPEYLRLLEWGDARTRMWAAYLLGWFPEYRDVITPALFTRRQTETNEFIVATICISAGLLATPGVTIEHLAEVLRFGTRRERYGSAIGLALMQPDIDREVLNELAACVTRGEDTGDDTPYGLYAFAGSLVYERDGGWAAHPTRHRSPGLQIR